MHPPVLIAPVDPIDDPDARRKFETLAAQVALMSHGDVLAFDVPIEVYHKVDGYWILSQDLAEMLAAEKDAPREEKHEPAESTYTPPGCKTIDDDDR